MKDSGVELIGVIPEEWSAVRLKYLCRIQTGEEDTQDANEDGEYPFYVRSPFIERSTKYTFDGEGILVAGDGAGAGRVFHHAFGKYAVHQRVYRLSDFHCHTRFLYNYLICIFPYEMDRGSAQSTVPSIRLPMLQNFRVLIPPTKMSGIANFLDAKCEEIDKVVEKTRESIEEYKKLKQAVITEAVTKGVRGSRPMKPSGVEWIGDIPAEWEIFSLRYIGSCQNGISKGGEYFGQGYPFISYSDVYKNITLPTSPTGLVETTTEEQKRYSVQCGDIFFTRTSETIEEIGIASVCCSNISCATFAGFLIRVRPYNAQILPHYSKYYFRSEIHRRFFVKEMNIVTRASLSQDLLKRMPVLLPDRNEQQEIANYLDAKCGEIDRLIAKKEQLITELEAYKKSLIYEYVTGKKEVPA